MNATSAEALRKRARERNEQLARRTRRWKQTRVVLMTVFVVAGTVLAYFSESLLAAVPLYAIAVLFLILYLDARGQEREILGRRWERLYSPYTRPPEKPGGFAQTPTGTRVP